MVECTALEMRRGGNSTGGSNPSLSAILPSDSACYDVANPASHRRYCPVLPAPWRSVADGRVRRSNKSAQSLRHTRFDQPSVRSSVRFHPGGLDCCRKWSNGPRAITAPADQCPSDARSPLPRSPHSRRTACIGSLHHCTFRSGLRERGAGYSGTAATARTSGWASGPPSTSH